MQLAHLRLLGFRHVVVLTYEYTGSWVWVKVTEKATKRRLEGGKNQLCVSCLHTYTHYPLVIERRHCVVNHPEGDDSCRTNALFNGLSTSNAALGGNSANSLVWLWFPTMIPSR